MLALVQPDWLVLAPGKHELLQTTEVDPEGVEVVVPLRVVSEHAQADGLGVDLAGEALRQLRE